MGFNLTEITNQSLNTESNGYQKLGGLVKRPFFYNEYSTTLGGTGTASYSAYGVSGNRDGSNSCIYVSVPTGLNNGVTIRFTFYGRAFGVRVQNLSTTVPFDVLIDGVSYTANPALATYESYGSDNECLLLIDDGLSDGLHYVELDFVSPASGTSSWNLLGILVDSRAGYDQPKRAYYQVDPIVLPTTDTAIYVPSIKSLRGIRKIIYANTTASPIQVSVKSSGTLVWTSNIPANGTDTLDFGDVTTYSTALTHSAATTGINATVIGSVI